MAAPEFTEGRFTVVTCRKCGTSFEVTSPEKEHNLAAPSNEAFGNKGIRSDHPCPKCKSITILYWG